MAHGRSQWGGGGRKAYAALAGLHPPGPLKRRGFPSASGSPTAARGALLWPVRTLLRPTGALLQVAADRGALL